MSKDNTNANAIKAVELARETAAAAAAAAVRAGSVAAETARAAEVASAAAGATARLASVASSAAATARAASVDADALYMELKLQLQQVQPEQIEQLDPQQDAVARQLQLEHRIKQMVQQ